MQLVTIQTGPEGQKVRASHRAGLDIARELYLGMLVDRATGRVVVMASTEGGMDIEEVAATTRPRRSSRSAIDPARRPAAYQARKLGFGLGLTKAASPSSSSSSQALYALFVGRTARCSRSTR
jgi:succinyl-CoA synthetase beta subunit